MGMLLAAPQWVLAAPRPHADDGDLLRIEVPGQAGVIGSVREEARGPEPGERRGCLGILLGLGGPRSSRHAVVRDETDREIVLSIRLLDPVIHEVARVNSADGRLVGRCISFAKTTLRGGFRIEREDRSPFAEVPLAASREDRRVLRLAGDGRELGSIVRESGEPAAHAPPLRYAVAAADGIDAIPLGRFFLLASAVTLALVDLRLRRALERGSTRTSVSDGSSPARDE